MKTLSIEEALQNNPLMSREGVEQLEQALAHERPPQPAFRLAPALGRIPPRDNAEQTQRLQNEVAALFK